MLKKKTWDQVDAIMMIPSRVFANWPAFFSFGIANAAAQTAISAMPAVNGPVGMIINYGLLGFRDVVKQVTWEAVRNK